MHQIHIIFLKFAQTYPFSETPGDTKAGGSENYTWSHNTVSEILNYISPSSLGLKAIYLYLEDTFQVFNVNYERKHKIVYGYWL